MLFLQRDWLLLQGKGQFTVRPSEKAQIFQSLHYTLFPERQGWSWTRKITKLRHRFTVRDNQIATHAKLLNIKYEFYGLNGDLIETIN